MGKSKLKRKLVRVQALNKEHRAVVKQLLKHVDIWGAEADSGRHDTEKLVAENAELHQELEATALGLKSVREHNHALLAKVTAGREAMREVIATLDSLLNEANPDFTSESLKRILRGIRTDLLEHTRIHRVAKPEVTNNDG